MTCNELRWESDRIYVFVLQMLNFYVVVCLARGNSFQFLVPPTIRINCATNCMHLQAMQRGMPFHTASEYFISFEVVEFHNAQTFSIRSFYSWVIQSLYDDGCVEDVMQANYK